MVTWSNRLLRLSLPYVLRIHKENSNVFRFCEKTEGQHTLRRYYSQDDPNIVHSPFGEVEIPNLLFHEYVFQKWNSWEKKIGVQCAVTDRKYSYRNMMKYSKKLAAFMQHKFNMSKGDLLAVILPNCPEFPIVVLASSMAGIVLTSINPIYTPYEISWQFKDCNAKLVITDTLTHKKFEEVFKLLGKTVPIINVKLSREAQIPAGGIDISEIFNLESVDALNPVTVDPEDELFLPYSSGTTGSPKGAILTHRNVVANLTQIGIKETHIMNPTTFFSQDTIIAVLPMFHIYGLVVCTFFSLSHGCKLIVMPKFNPFLYIATIVKKRCRILYIAPPILILLADPRVPAKYLKRVDFIVNGASAIIEKEANIIEKKASHIKIVQGYGMTEASPVLTHSNPERVKLSSIGVPVASTKIKIVDIETGKTLPKGQVGELCALGPQVMKGYLNRPEESKAVFDEEGWLKTGDLGYYDDENDFYIVDRLKDLIKAKGFQVNPSELEEVLRSHPKIKDAGVVGVKHEAYGEAPKAFIVLKEGETMTEEEVQAFVQEKLAPYKQLRGGVKFLEDLPKSMLGKVLRKELKKLDES